MRGRSALLIAVLLSTSAHAEDQLFGVDKALHFSASFGIAAVAYTGAAFIKEPVEGRLASAIGIALFAGVAKELIDSQGFGSLSTLDLAWDLAGTVLGTLAVWLIDRLFFGGPSPRPSPLRGEREATAGSPAR